MPERPQKTNQAGKGEDALSKVVHYRTRRRQPLWELVWGGRFYQLDETCKALYLTGLEAYQGWTFTEIFRAQQKDGRMNQKNTLDKHLKHLIAFDFVRRKPRIGGRGKPGKYYFTEMARISDNWERVIKHHGRADEEYRWVQFVGAPSSKTEESKEKAEELAKKLRLIYVDYGIELMILMEGMAKLTDWPSLVRYAEFETLLLRDELAGISLELTRGYRDVMDEGVRIFRDWLTAVANPRKT